MIIIVGIINKLLFITFFMSLFIIVRHGFLFGRHIKTPDPEKYTISRRELLYLGLSFAYIITTIFKGISI